MSRTTTVAIVQQPPAVLDLTRSLERAADHIAAAADLGADLVVFPETWLTCYPAWAFGLAGWANPEARHWHGRLLAESPVLGGIGDRNDGIAPLRSAAAEHGVTVVIGLNERSARGGTLYNSLATIGPDGLLLNVHRKLMPTHTERTIWGIGDAAGLHVVDTPAGRIGGLVCWEHWMPPARQTLHAASEQIHVAAWPDTPEMHQIAARSYAFEGRCFVASAGLYLTSNDVPAELLDAYLAGVGPDIPSEGALFDGGSSIIGPDGMWIVEPVHGRPEIVTAILDLSAIDREHQDLDVVGHYARDDIFELTVDARRRSGVTVITGR
ncbi:carbon-nitrogen hydrolase family protein [Amycolatopsis taiwanensis]|uniref:Nitrilase n=1 Tax=Amycolatopsis taiwanensis TaxID=342230 RepID=A0A9W6R2C0_9PSEU|nr:carbon-nitrogen hydrolase family protein [Amycolatopsis taiwanensis]GLY67998.1 nitrilase [Amycolatopsis taiwanensis]